MTNKIKQYKEKTNIMITSFVLFLFSIVPTFADGDLPSVIKSAIKGIQSAITMVFDPICVTALAVCIVILVLGRNSKSADSSMSWAKRIVICFIVFNLLTTIIGWLKGTISDAGGEGLFMTLLPVM